LTEGATDRFQYATNVVAQSLKPRPSAWFWYGSFTGLTWFLDTFAWRTIWVFLSLPLLPDPQFFF
jgi:1-acylglycerone phosphate reductase